MYTYYKKLVCKPINWSEDHHLIHRTLGRMSLKDFLALANLSNNHYFKMLASDLQYEGPPSVNLQRAYKELGNIRETVGFLEKVDGFWTLRNGKWTNIVPEEVRNAR